MTENCFFNEFKGGVNNNNLSVYGAWSIRREDDVPAGWSYSTDRIVVFGNDGDVIHIESDDVTEILNSYSGVAISLPADLAISVGSSYMRQFALQQKGTIRISSKYVLNRLMFAGSSHASPNEDTEMKVLGTLKDFTYKNNPEEVTELLLAGTKITGDISSLNRLPNLQRVNLLRLGISGNIKSIASLTNLTSLFVQDTEVTGTAADLGVFVNAYSLGIYKSKITGSVEEFVSSQIAHGKTTRTPEDSPLYSNGVLGQLSFGGSKQKGIISNGAITWESASKIAVYTGAPTISDSTHVYCKGYTQEEAETAFSGKTIIIVDA